MLFVVVIFIQSYIIILKAIFSEAYMNSTQEIMAIGLLIALALTAIIIVVRIIINNAKYKNFKKTREQNLTNFKNKGFVAQDGKIANKNTAVYFDHTNKKLLVEKFDVIKCYTKLEGPYPYDKITAAALAVNFNKIIDSCAKPGFDISELLNEIKNAEMTEPFNECIAKSIAILLFFDGVDIIRLKIETLEKRVSENSDTCRNCVSSTKELFEAFKPIITG